MEPAPALVVELLADGVDEGGGVAAAMTAAASSGTTPSSAQAAVAACSTASHVASFPSSDQMLAMAGRE